MDATRRRPDTAILAIAGVIVLLVAIALVAVLTRGGTDTLDPDSPEGVVQDFAAAMIQGQGERATELVDESALDDCDAYGNYHRGGFPDADTRVTLRGVTAEESTAIVRVGIMTGYDGGVFGGSYEETGEFTLVRSEGDWRVMSAPWQFDICALGAAR